MGGVGYILVKGFLGEGDKTGINYGLRTSGLAWDAFFMEGGAWKGAFNKGKVKGGKWVYMTATYDGVNEIRVYENGEVIGSSERGKPPPSRQLRSQHWRYGWAKIITFSWSVG